MLRAVTIESLREAAGARSQIVTTAGGNALRQITRHTSMRLVVDKISSWWEAIRRQMIGILRIGDHIEVVLHKTVPFQ